MKQIIRKYVAKGFTVSVVQYSDGGKNEYHVEHNFPGVPGSDWYEEYEKAKAIAQAQFIAGWINRQKGVRA